MQGKRFSLAVALAAALGLGAAPAAAVPTAPGYVVDFLVTPGPAAGDVVASGGAVFAGSGSFGVGQQSVVRLDSGGTTVIAEGFNSLGGFALDPANDRLVVGDNAGDLGGAATGDTIFGIPAPFGSPASPPDALGLELLSANSVPGYADTVLDPGDASGNTLFIGDASGDFPPNGVVLQADLGVPGASVIQSGLEFTAGLAADATTLYVGNSLFSGAGEVLTIPLATPTMTPGLLTTLPGGVFDLEIGPDGSIFASTGGEIVQIDPTSGAVTPVASGFQFTGGIFVDDAGVIYAIDGFPATGLENRVWTFTPVPEPGTAVLGAMALVALARRRSARWVWALSPGDADQAR